ncbi:uncharacterized protein LOC106664645 [Cimex lectularius]|uniref:Circadian clock-controlled protein n=1 Tax=Cimex lectularius TaxID=79782 RepID=A0A8I6RIF6_CIMLE|nr:uncharacterized protein LOC106664645 [Cimex lectularius]
MILKRGKYISPGLVGRRVQYTMALRLSLFLVALSTLTHGAVLKNGDTIPTYAKVCRRSQIDFNSCFRESLQIAIQKISKDGIRQLKVPSLDPWRVDKLTINYGTGTPFKVSMHVKNSDVYGFSRLQILNVRSNFDDPEAISMEIDFSNKKVFIEGDYNAEGLISDVPVLASGKYNVSMSNVSGTLKIKGRIVKKSDGEEYLQVIRSNSRPDVGDMVISMTNENNKYPELHNLFLVLMNQFWKVMYEELLPYAEENFNEILTPMFNMATFKIPFNQLIPQ